MRDQQRRVNQKLSFARWHLDWADQRATGEAQRLALMESAVFHAMGAYRSFLAEIAADQHHPRPPAVEGTPETAAGLSAAYEDYLPPALAECLHLEQQGGWLSDLLARYRQAQCLEAPRRMPRSADLIASATPDGVADLSAVRHVLAELEVLIERLRSQMQEC